MKPPDICFCHPEIAGNTGTIIRLCAITGSKLHLIEPFGFNWDDKELKRSGLDYHEFADVKRYKTFDDFVFSNKDSNIYAFRTQAKTLYTQISYKSDDILLFGKESSGLEEEVYTHRAITNQVKLPMKEGFRSLNLAVSASIGVYEAWRQLGF